MVVAAGEVDRQPVLERQPARQRRPAGGVAHRREDSPVDEGGRQPGQDRHAEDLRQDASTGVATAGIRACGPARVRGADRLRTHEIGRLPQAIGDEGIVDPPVFQAVERV